MPSKKTRPVQFESEPPACAPHEGGWYVFTDSKQETVTDKVSGETLTVWTATATWQEEEPVT
jgi:hypothetical protein